MNCSFTLPIIRSSPNFGRTSTLVSQPHISVQKFGRPQLHPQIDPNVTARKQMARCGRWAMGLVTQKYGAKRTIFYLPASLAVHCTIPCRIRLREAPPVRNPKSVFSLRILGPNGKSFSNSTESSIRESSSNSQTTKPPLDVTTYIKRPQIVVHNNAYWLLPFSESSVV